MPNATPDTIRILARQAARWTTAARQDANPIIAMLHGSYGAAYVFALRQVASDIEIKRVTGIDAAALEQEIVAVQDAVTARLARTCPKAAPRGRLTRLSREGIGRIRIEEST